MKWIFLALFLMAFTPRYNEHDSKQKIDDEFNNIEDSLQDEQFTVFNSTPNLADLKDGQIVIVSSMTFNNLMFRSNQEIYSVTASCVTVRR